MKYEQLFNLPIEWKRGSGLRKSDLVEGGSYKCILYGELFTKHKKALIENRNFSRTNKAGIFYSKKGDILIPGTSTASKKDMLLAREIEEDGVIIGGDINVIRPQQGLFAKKFLPYFFDTSSAYDQLDRYITGATGIIHISNTGLKKLKVPIPNFQEQQRIVSILDKCFEAIDKAKTNAERNLKNTKELFESYLNEVFEEENEDWEEKTLGDVCKISSKLIDPKKIEFQELIHVGAGNIIAQKGTLINLKTAKEENLISGKFLFDETMVLYSKIRPYLMKVLNCNFQGLCSADIYPLVPFNNILDKGFLYYLLLTKKFTDYAILGSQRAGMPKVNREHLFAYRIKLPSIKSQQLIVQKLATLGAEMDKLEHIYTQKLNDLDDLKQSILQKAFRGELNTEKN
jgi:type I restriction enzyme S subunit